MRFRSTLILALVLVGLGAYVYFVELPKEANEDKKESLFSLKADEITEIDLQFPDRKIHLKKSGSQWQLTEPITADAESSAVDGMLSSITGAEIKKKLEGAAGDAAKFGLDKPVVTVALQQGDKALTPFSVGKDTPIGGLVYVQRKDEPNVLLTASTLKLGVDKQVKDLRDKKLVTFADDDVQWIEVKSTRGDLRAVKTDGDKWNIEQPQPYAGDPSALRTYASSVRALRAVDFVEENAADLARYGLDDPRLKISVGLKGDAVKTILIGNKKEGSTDIYAQVEGKPAVYTIADSNFRNVDKQVRDLRDKMILSFNQADATSVEVTRKGSDPYRLVLGNDGKWAIEGSTEPLKANLVDQFLADLHELKAYEIAGDNPRNLAELGLDAPRLKVTVNGKNGPLGTVSIGETEAKDGTKNFNTMRDGNPTVYLLRAYLFTRLDKSKDDFSDKPTPAAPPAS